MPELKALILSFIACIIDGNIDKDILSSVILLLYICMHYYHHIHICTYNNLATAKQNNSNNMGAKKTYVKPFFVCEGVFILSISSNPENTGLFSLLASCFYVFQLLVSVRFIQLWPKQIPFVFHHVWYISFLYHLAVPYFHCHLKYTSVMSFDPTLGFY